MKKENLKKLKKYLFLISILFCLVTLSHITYSYIYENSKSIPIKWWSISEWIVWEFPSLNPLRPISWNNEYILNLLYRSILKYDIDQKKIVWDIASCDISSLVNIECVINEDAVWSDWTSIESSDIESTYNLIKETNSNPTISSLLKDVKIESRWNIIVFKNKVKDTNFLNIFFQPIISQKTIDKLSQENIEWNFPYNNIVYSWNYILENISADETKWVSKIILKRNENFWESNISKINIYIFPDENSLKRNKQVINIYNDETNAIWDSIPRLESNRYNLPQFLSLFINVEKIKGPDLRNFILNEVNRENLIDHLWKVSYKAVKNPYLTEKSIEKKPENKNLKSVMASIGYKKKSILIQELKKDAEEKAKKKNPEKKEESKKEVVKVEEIDESKWIDRYQKDSKTIKSPKYVEKYNFITKEDFKLIWDAPEETEAIYINNYKLKWFKKWDSEFFYRLKEGYDNIKEWKNTYKIYFEKNWKKELKEEITFLYYKDRKKLEEETEKFVKSLYEAEKKEIEKKSLEDKKETEKKEEEPLKIDKETLAKLEKLDDKLFYSPKLKPYTLSLVYLNSRKDFEETAKFIKNSLKEIWISVELKPLDKKWFGEALLKKEYDMILWWIDLSYFSFNIFPYFHSSQASSWFNYSSIKKTSLDLLLEESKENIYNEEKTEEIKNKALDILKDLQSVKTLYSPKVNLLIDKNIKINKEISELPSSSLRSKIIWKSYIKQEKVISLKWKSFSWFVVYLFKKLYE